ncbi:Agenet-like domain [Dillenia turbinata]|uniref:Agenet-like domain n=1 Tax=Dillenia turbinata TaxID=194707 RepID=A0AAN8URA3_9MAGN
MAFLIEALALFRTLGCKQLKFCASSVSSILGYFRRGDLVEVCSKEEGVLPSYNATAVILEVRDNGYLVEQCKSLLTDDEALPPLTEMLPAKQVRPNPPEIPVKGFSFLDQVDAFANDG